MLPCPTRSIEILLDLLARNPVSGGEVFDLHLVATMLANDVSTIYTFNIADFAVFPGVTAIVPGL